MKWPLKLIVMALLALPGLAWGQGAVVTPGLALRNTGPAMVALPNAVITVCAANSAATPCSPPLSNTVFSDQALQVSKTNPFFADANGNYNFAVAAGTYTVTVSSGLQGYSYQLTVQCALAGSCTWTGSNSFTGTTTFNNITINGVCSGSCGNGSAVGLSLDNTWTNNDRFKGPIPWRDITAYMPAGGCSSATVSVDPQTTGTISSGSPNLVLASAKDFKNGCGIAVLNAGPTSTIPTPNQGCSIGSISRSSNVVTVTCAAPHNIPVYNFDHFEGIQITGVTDSSFNGTFDVTTVADTTHFTYGQAAGNASSSSGTATMQFGYAHGATGATTYNYKVSAVDALGGMSPASAIIAVTSGNATLDTNNYNWINFGASFTPFDTTTVPHEWVIYSDKGLGGAYSCVGTSFTNGYSDFGLPMPCPAFAPATPPGAATPQILNAIIVSGGGTSALTLNVSAGNNATTQNTYHDESSFLNSCIIDDRTDRNPTGFPAAAGTYGCYIPAGNYYMNGQLATDNFANTIGGSIYVSGSLFFNIFPMYLSKSSYFIKGSGGSGTIGQFSHANTTPIYLSTSLAAGIVIRGAGNIEVSGISMTNLHGDGIWVGGIAYLAAQNSFRFDNDIIAEAGGGAGAPLHIDNNTIGLWSTNLSLSPSSSAIALPSIYVTMSNYNQNPSCCMYFVNLTTIIHGIKFDGPGGNGSGGNNNTFSFLNWIHESLAGGDLGLITHDDGPNMTGAISSVTPVSGIAITSLNNSDPVGGPAAHALFAEMGSAAQIGYGVAGAGAFGSLLKCGPAATSCAGAGGNSLPPLTGTNFGGPTGGNWGGDASILSGVLVAQGVLSELGYSGYASNPPAWAEMLPPPGAFQVTGTTAGSLAANTYCLAVEGKDGQTAPGLTLPSNIVCQAVGASGAIQLSWTQITGQVYSGFRLFWCAGAACTPNAYIADLAAGGSPYTTTFTSTAGSTGLALATAPTAYLSFFGWGGLSCWMCTSSGGNALYQIGIGDWQPPAGVKMSVKGPFLATSLYGKSLVATRLVDPSNFAGWAGADVCAWITSAEAALPAAGGRVEVATGTYSACAAGFAIGSSTQVVSLQTDVVISVQNQVTIGNGSELSGIAPNAGSGVLGGLQASGTYPSNTKLLKFQASPTADAIRVHDVYINCAGFTGCWPIDAGSSQDQTVIRNALLYNFMGGCIDFTNAASQAGSVENTTCVGATTAGAVDGIVMNNTGDHWVFTNVGVGSQSATQLATGVKCNACTVYVHGAHMENAVDAFQFGTAGDGNSVIDGANGLSNVTNLIHIVSTYTGSLTAFALRKNAGTNIVKNDIAAFNHTCTDASLANYVLSSTNSSPQQLSTFCSNLASVFRWLPVAALVTTAATTDNVTVTGMTSSGHCTMSPTNAAAATDSTSTYISAKATNQITVTHPVSANRNWDISCTPN